MKSVLFLGLLFLSLTFQNFAIAQEKEATTPKVTKPKTTTTNKVAVKGKTDSVKVKKAVSTAKPTAKPVTAKTTATKTVKKDKAIVAESKPTQSSNVNNAQPEAIVAKESDGIHWLTLREIEARMREKPKKVFIDVYTGWCGWCKRMEATTFTNPALIKYVNNNFYAMRLDAEMKESFQFNGKEYHFDPQNKANTFAMELLKGQMGYPTSVFMMENFQNPTPIPGYHPVKEMEMFLLYFGDNICMHKDMGSFQKTFVSAWDHGDAPPMTAPQTH